MAKYPVRVVKLPRPSVSTDWSPVRKESCIAARCDNVLQAKQDVVYSKLLCSVLVRTERTENNTCAPNGARGC
ncbi:hypothetical protein RRG08_053173 [Elysia crispata]|uniref:Uncharacterized protein n=1 Tax=Elysia crispata TaxID=231223 RepID=A0AAE1D3I2_9GAST|nr:hypothetical protein RRG08_053173 [Elysia crispata]